MSEAPIKYPAVIDGDVGAYGVVLPDLPGAYAMGATVDEALADAESMLPEFLEVWKESGKTIPIPKAVGDIALQPGEMLAFVTLRATTMLTK